MRKHKTAINCNITLPDAQINAKPTMPFWFLVLLAFWAMLVSAGSIVFAVFAGWLDAKMLNTTILTIALLSTLFFFPTVWTWLPPYNRKMVNAMRFAAYTIFIIVFWSLAFCLLDAAALVIILIIGIGVLTWNIYKAPFIVRMVR